MRVLLALFLSAAPALAADEVVYESGAHDLIPSSLMLMPEDRGSARVPPGRLIKAARMEATASDGRRLGGEFICHNNIGPSYRGFNHGRKILLDGYTREVVMPPGFGVAPESGDFLFEVMYNNPLGSPLKGARTSFALDLVPEGERVVALYPQMMSVFEQPPDVGAGEWGYYVMPRAKDHKRRLYDVTRDYVFHYASFHIHDRGRRILLRSLTTGRTLVDARPVYKDGHVASVPTVSRPRGVVLKKGEVLELSVDYENPLARVVDAMGAAILFGRCPDKPDCEAVAQRPAENKGFDARLYQSLIAPGALAEGGRRRPHRAP